jgi:hypothetical protein
MARCCDPPNPIAPPKQHGVYGVNFSRRNHLYDVCHWTPFSSSTAESAEALASLSLTMAFRQLLTITSLQAIVTTPSQLMEKT